MSIFNRNRPVRDYAADKRDRDVEILRRILLRSPSAALCEELVAFKKSTQPLTRCAALMADTCREPEWRLYFQRTGLLVMYLDALKGAIINERDLAMETLRFAANCVIEVDENRHAVLRFLPLLWAIAEKGDEHSFHAFSVMVNLCEDCEPSRKALIGIKFHERIVPVLKRRLDAKALCAALLLLTEMIPAIRADGQELSSDLNTTMINLHLPAYSLGHIDYMQYIECLIRLLEAESVQIQFAALPNSIAFIMQLLDRCAARMYFMEQNKASEDDVEQICQLLSGLVGSAADVAFCWQFKDSDFFLDALGNSDDEILTNNGMLPLIHWMELEWKIGQPTIFGPRPRSNMALANAAMMMLGNAVQNDRVAKAIVRTAGFNRIPTLCHIIVRDSDSKELQLSAATLFGNLAVPVANKDIMRGACGFEIAEKLILGGNPKESILVIGGLKLLRRLLTNSTHNADAFCAAGEFRENRCLKTFIAIMERIPIQLPLKSKLTDTDPKEAAKILESATPVATDPMYDDVAVIDPHIRAEIGRVVVEVYRSMKRNRLLSPTSIPDSPPRGSTACFDKNHHAAAALIFICTHPDQTIKSEGYLALGLMSATKEGAANIWFVLHQRGMGVIGFLKGKHGLFRKFTDEEEEEEKAASGPLHDMTKADRGNALTLVGNLVILFGHEMSNEERESLKMLLALHGEMTNKIKSTPTERNQFEGIFQHGSLTHAGSSVSSAGATWATAGPAKDLSASPTGTDGAGLLVLGGIGLLLPDPDVDVVMDGEEKEMGPGVKEEDGMEVLEKGKEDDGMAVDGARNLAVALGNVGIRGQEPLGHSRNDSGGANREG